MAQTMTKYWYISPISIILLDDEDGSPFRMKRGDLVQGWLWQGDTEATSKLRIGKVGNREVFGNVVLPIGRFEKFDIEHAYLED